MCQTTTLWDYVQYVQTYTPIFKLLNYDFVKDYIASLTTSSCESFSFCSDLNCVLNETISPSNFVFSSIILRRAISLGDLTGLPWRSA